MIPLHKLQTVRFIVVHEYADKPCPDGLASALILQDALPEATVFFAQHNTPFLNKMTAHPHMLFCDITPPRNRVHEFVEAGSIVLDHHKQSEDIVKAFDPHGVFADEKLHPGVSGALLAYNEVWKYINIKESALHHARVQDFAILAGIRDTWQKNHSRWEESCRQAAALSFFPVKSWLDCIDNDNFFENVHFQSMMNMGGLLLYKKELETEKLLEFTKVETLISGTKYAVLPSLEISDASDILLKSGEIKFVVGFGIRNHDNEVRIQLSFRSRGSFDVGAVAKSFGGGGHTNAAGVIRSYGSMEPNPYTYIMNLLNSQL